MDTMSMLVVGSGLTIVVGLGMFILIQNYKKPKKNLVVDKKSVKRK